jgi:hypothetical protein
MAGVPPGIITPARGPDTYATQDRIQVLVVVVTAATGQTFYLRSCISFSTQKSDSGDAGSWSCSFLPRNPDVIFANSGTTDVPDDIVAYSQCAGPSDLVAIFARRISVTSDGRVERPAPFIGPSEITDFSWGDGNAASVTTLAAPTQAAQQVYDASGNLSITTPYLNPQSIGGSGNSTAGGKVQTPDLAPTSNTSCLMIGMLDGADFQQDAEGQIIGWQMNGRDLSKVFYENDTMIPASAEGAVGILPLISLALSKEGSGTQLLLDIADITVAKQSTSSTVSSTNLGSGTFSQYGFPWRNFISLARLTTGFRSFVANGKYVPFQIQQGSAWANMQELRNPPLNRLFVDEWGQIVFDDQLGAWQNQPYTTIGPTEVIAFGAGFNDSSLITFLSTFPNGSLGARYNIGTAQALGLQRNNYFVGGFIAPANPDATIVQRYGYRYSSWSSNYDLDYDSCSARREVVAFQANNLWKGRLAVRGGPYYRVGDRYLVNVESERIETSYQIWYAQAIGHQWTFGGPWITSLSLGYPPLTGSNSGTQ